MKMDINDIISNPDPVVLDIIEKELQTLSEQGLHNVENYQGLLDEIQDYDCFHVITEGNTLVAFGGLYSKRWGNVGRALQRAYKNPLYRRKSLSYNSTTDSMQHLWSSVFAPLQVDVAQKLGLDAVFVTTEFPRRWGSLNTFTQRLDGIFEMLPDMYFICNKYNKQGKYIGRHNFSSVCWQNTTLCVLNDDYTFNFESMTHNEWRTRFDKKWRDRLEWKPKS
tara:strand:+ start:228 stop:893 length:666 start_codon:yes stop_codon:yes gene_type:complete